MVRSALIGLCFVGKAWGAALWPPSSAHLANFSSDWQFLSDDYAAHSTWGGRTIVKSAGASGTGKLLVFLPGTFTVPAQFGTLLRYASDLGFDTIGLDYAWGPAPDSKRSAQCSMTGSCEECMENFHEMVLTGGGSDLVSGPQPIFGNEQGNTLKFTHFLSSGVQFLPTTELPAVNLSDPLQQAAQNYISSMRHFSIEVLLVRVLKHLGWGSYLAASDEIQWPKVFIAGHSQGGSHVGYAAYRHPVLGALMLSGPQDLCGDVGAARLPVGRPHIYGCYAVDEPGAGAIESNLAVFTEVRTINTTGRPRPHGQGAWCPPPAHCATAVDDQLVDEAIEQCFSMMRHVVDEHALWPPSRVHLGTFGSDWRILSGDFAAHSAQGGRTIAKSAAAMSSGKLLVFLPGTFTVPAQFSTLLKYAVNLGFDTIGLDYAWGPAPDSKRSAQCTATDYCEACMDNFHERVLTGGGLDLLTGPQPIFGDEQDMTLKFTHFFSSGVQFIPTTKLPEVNLSAPLQQVAREYISSMRHFSIEVLLVRVLKELGWSHYLLATDEVQWPKVFIAGHSQGGSHVGYAAYRYPVLGALMLSGPQDMCGERGAARLPVGRSHIYGCYAVDEPGARAIEINLAVFTEVRTINTTGRPRNHGQGAWCPPPAHCATAVDDQLVDEAIEQCFSLMRNVLDVKPPGMCAQIPRSAFNRLQERGIKARRC